MQRKSLDDLGELQRTVLETVWDLREANVHKVRERLARKKKLAYTTVLSAMQKLEKAGWLDHRAEGKTYVYFATASRDQAGAGSVRGFLSRVFEGDAVAMFQHLIRESDLSDDELRELRRMIDDKRKERKP
ncbi:MAG TPA: BlaI/MecI/CopY family transcriptional regulator [Sedimentisphaerales bacterium]|nr:BlaI/MecI/CopY family transcriptional regulator [Sedimentisphaerales bacterium]HNU27707.1 BlaI/MecI/CopY family transcriptional regulator [Sedimentisphaerales bacterium]